MARILVIRLSSLGDVAMLVPVIASVAAAHPQDRFSVVTRVAFAPLFRNLSFNINVIPIDLKNKHSGLKGFFRVTWRCLIMRITDVADVHDVLRTKALRWSLLLTGSRVKHIEKGRKQKKAMLRTKETVPPLEATVDRYMDVFDKLGYGTEISFNSLFDFVPRSITKLKPLVSDKIGYWVGIAPFAKHDGKIYPVSKTEDLIAKLSEDENISIFLFGNGSEEKAQTKEWASKYAHTVSVPGNLNFENEMMLMSYLDVMVSMDSANMHLASLVNIPVISIWGSTHPALGFYGYKQDPGNAVQIELDCRPCSVYGEKPCVRTDEEYACLKQIPEDLIISKVYNILNKQK